jgi:hypothetical protein
MRDIPPPPWSIGIFNLAGTAGQNLEPQRLSSLRACFASTASAVTMIRSFNFWRKVRCHKGLWIISGGEIF